MLDEMLEERINQFPFSKEPMKEYDGLKEELKDNQKMLDKLDEVYDRYFSGYCGEFLFEVMYGKE